MLWERGKSEELVRIAIPRSCAGKPGNVKCRGVFGEKKATVRFLETPFKSWISLRKQPLRTTASSEDEKKKHTIETTPASRAQGPTLG